MGDLVYHFLNHIGIRLHRCLHFVGIQVSVSTYAAWDMEGSSIRKADDCDCSGICLFHGLSRVHLESVVSADRSGISHKGTAVAETLLM